MSISTLQEAGQHNGFTASFTGGKSQGGNAMTMEINFICNQASIIFLNQLTSIKAAGNGYPTVLTKSGTDFQFEWKTSLACIASSSSRFPVGGIFLIM